MDIAQLRQFAPQIRKIAQKHGIARVYVFGSVARGEANTPSDVDFLVEMHPGASLFGAAGFGYEAEKLLGVPVDVVPRSVLDEINDREFAVRVEQDAVVL
jgi:uncharacterized protein